MPPNGKKFEHACFISYKHPPKSAGEDHFYREFVEAFRDRLDFYLTSSITAYLDVDADLGSSYPTELSQKLCKSVCMIAVMVPEYPDSNWCRAEWEAMEKLEARRLNGGRGLIIPIALRCSPAEWNARLQRKPADFSNIALPKKQLSTLRYSQKIKEIAEIINKWERQLADTCDDCEQFQFVVGEEVLAAEPTFKDPNPFE